MRSFSLRTSLALVLCGTSLVAACGAPDPLAEGTVDTATESLSQNGFTTIITDLGVPGGPSMVGIAACDANLLYSVRSNGATPPSYTLYMSKDGAVTWTQVMSERPMPGVAIVPKGPEIACDRAVLYSMDSAKNIYVGQILIPDGKGMGGMNTFNLIRSTGNLDQWALVNSAKAVDRIQGGSGMVYGVKSDSATAYRLFLNTAGYGGLAWGGSVATIGAPAVSGWGTNAASTPVHPAAARAFAMNPDGTVYFNDSILTGQNGWTFLNLSTVRFKAISAGWTTPAFGPTLYGIDQTNGHLYRVRFSESSCKDGGDNDGDGLVDVADDDCTQSAGNDFCATRSNGSYCSSNLGGLVKCTNTKATTITRGVCKSLGTASRLATNDELAKPDPAGFGRYCNVVYSDGTWDFKFGGTEPCTEISRTRSGGTIVRAGLFSTSGPNNIRVACNNGGITSRGTGSAALDSANNTVGHTANQCVFTVSPDTLPLFDGPPYALTNATAISNPYDHQVGDATVTNYHDAVVSGRAGHTAYDYVLAEGTPILSVGRGRVIGTATNPGSRDRNISDMVDITGTPFQAEISIQYEIGSSSIYRESFVAYYAHMRQRLVQTGESVSPGQVIGYAGTTGSSTGPHLHFGALRATNTNDMQGTLAAGYKVSIVMMNDNVRFDSGVNTQGINTADPYGWAGARLDPWAVANSSANVGAWSPKLWAGSFPSY